MKKILLIEDDAWLAELQMSLLKEAGYTVALAPHAPAGIVMIDEFAPDAIVLDVLLAGSTAFALLNELQSHGDTAKVPIVLCTNLAEQFDSSRLAAYGVVRVVDKTTMHPSDLVATLRLILP